MSKSKLINSSHIEFYEYLCSYNADNGVCNPTNAELVRTFGVSRQTINKWLKRLESIGYIDLRYLYNGSRHISINDVYIENEHGGVQPHYEFNSRGDPPDDDPSINIYIYKNSEEEKNLETVKEIKGESVRSLNEIDGSVRVDSSVSLPKDNVKGVESSVSFDSSADVVSFDKEITPNHGSVSSVGEVSKLDSIVDELNQEPVVLTAPLDGKDKSMMKAYRDSWASFLLYHWELNSLQGNGSDEDSKYTVGMVSIELKGRHLEKLEAYSDNGLRLSVVSKAIRNYAEVLHSNEAYWSHRDTIEDFVYKRMSKFVNPSSYRVGSIDNYV